MVDRVAFGFIAGLDGPRCRKCLLISSMLARPGTVDVILWPSTPAELRLIMKVAVMGLLDRACGSDLPPTEFTLGC